MPITYNIYKDYHKINKKMISEDEIDKIKNSNFIFKKQRSGKIEKIPIDDIKIKKCIIL